MKEILDYLRANGEQTDAQIAKALKLPVAKVLDELAKLGKKGELITCDRIRMQHAKEVRETLYRAHGYIPPRTPGPKAK
jgi:hypothetical protein